MPAPRSRLSRLWVDISPLREFPAYRRLWVGDLVASGGSQFAAVALPYQVYRQTGSSLQVGLIGLAALGPLLVGALASGVIADAFDRKRLLLASQSTSAAGCVLLAFLTASGHTPLAVLYLLAALLAFASSVESPVRNAVIPSLVGLARVPSTAALNQIVDQTSQIAGPAVAGVLLAAFGITVTYVAAAAGALRALAGAADVISALFRNTILQQVTPDQMRGRMASLHIAVVTSGPRLGDVESGVVASLTSVRFSVVSGGLICIAGAGLMQLLLPALSRYQRPAALTAST